jgi:hypothetical protein
MTWKHWQSLTTKVINNIMKYKFDNFILHICPETISIQVYHA